jgi:hypothetical protein
MINLKKAKGKKRNVANVEIHLQNGLHHFKKRKIAFY